MLEEKLIKLGKQIHVAKKQLNFKLAKRLRKKFNYVLDKIKEATYDG